jgi:hypothetical protein
VIISSAGSLHCCGSQRKNEGAELIIHLCAQPRSRRQRTCLIFRCALQLIPNRTSASDLIFFLLSTTKTRCVLLSLLKQNILTLTTKQLIYKFIHLLLCRFFWTRTSLNLDTKYSYSLPTTNKLFPFTFIIMKVTAFFGVLIAFLWSASLGESEPLYLIL